MSASFPRLSDRVLSVSYYLGLGPLTGIVRSPSSNAFLGHHKGQALAALFVLLLLFLTACLFDTAETILFVGFPDIANDLAAHYGRVAIFVDSLWLVVALVVGVFWIGLLALAFRGSNWKVPVLKRLAERKWILRISSVINFLVLGAIPVVAIFAAQGTSLTRPSGDRGAVYFLYDEGVGVPRWAFALGLYRVSLQARRNWGSPRNSVFSVSSCKK